MNAKRLFSGLLILIFLLQFKFFWLVPFDAFYSVNSNQQQILMLVIILIGFVIFKFAPVSKDTTKLGRWIVIFVFLYVLELTVSAANNGQGLINAFISSNYYLIILLYFLGSYFVRKWDTNLNATFKYIVTLSFINFMVCWLQFILYKFGIVFTRLNLSAARFSSTRIIEISDTVACFGIIICIAELLCGKSKNKTFPILVTVLGISGMLIVGKGRITILAMILSVVAMVLWKFRQNAIKIICLLLLMMGIAFIGLRSSLGQMYLESFNDQSTDTYSIRQKEYSYYNSQTLRSPILGTGFIRDLDDAQTAEMRGPQNSYSRTDIGILGTANIMGIMGVLWYVVALLIVTMQIFRALRQWNDRVSLAALGMLVMCVVYIPTMVMFNPFSTTAFAILLIVSNGLSEKRKDSAEY